MAPPRRRPLGALFAFLAAGFAALAVFAAGGESWLIAIVAGVLCLWMGELAYRSLR